MQRNRKKDNALISGLDIGSTKTCLITGELTSEGLTCRGLYTLPTEGIKKGVVTEPDSCVRVIQELLGIGRAESGAPLKEVYVAMPGSQLEVIETSGTVHIRGAKVSIEETERAIGAAAAASAAEDREILHVAPKDFLLDGALSVPDPVGMSAASLEVRALVLTAALTPIQDMLACIDKAGVAVTDIVLQSLAAAESSVSMEERLTGIALADIGGGTTDLSIFQGGHLCHAYSVGVAGFHLTNDLSLGLGIPFADAEELKISQGTVMDAEMTNAAEPPSDRTLEVPHGVPLSKLVEILRPRAEEIIELIDAQISLVNNAGLPVRGLVLTGGSVLLTGLDRLAEQMLGMPVRIGQPTFRSHICLTDRERPIPVILPGEAASPAYAAAVGLLLHGAAELHELRRALARPRLYARLMSTLSSWFTRKQGVAKDRPKRYNN